MKQPRLVTKTMKSIRRPEPTAPPIAGGPPPPVHVAFGMNKQLLDFWCWAAVAEGISNHFGGAGHTQCTLANRIFNHNDCCPHKVGCDLPADLETALGNSKGTGNLLGLPKGPLLFLEVVKHLSIFRRPLPCRIGYTGGGGHSVVITGAFRIGLTDYLHIKDPDAPFQDAPYPFSDFPNHYKHIGKWTETYITKA